MKNKNVLLILILIFAVLISGAYILYSRMAEEIEPDQFAAQAKPEEESSEQAGPQKVAAPDFTVYDLEGNAHKLSDYVGKPIVLNFWASWCGPCKAEMPHFDGKYLEMGDEIQFLMVNVTGGRERLESATEFIADSGYSFPVFYDLDLDAAFAYGVQTLPTSYFIDAEGYVAGYAMGGINAATLQTAIDHIMQ